MDRVVPAEIVGTGQNGRPKCRQRQAALFVLLVAAGVLVHPKRERPLGKAGHRGCGTARQPVEESADFPVVIRTPLVGPFVARKQIERAGLRFLSLTDFGNTDGYEWYPPHLEQDLPSPDSKMDAAPLFLHPVLDRDRYMGSLLKFSSLPAFVHPGSRLWRAIRHFRTEGYWRRLPAAFLTRPRMLAREQWQMRTAPPPVQGGLRQGAAENRERLPNA